MSNIGGNLAGAFGISQTGILAGALRMIGVPDQIASVIGLATELSRGMTEDGFDIENCNTGALANHALSAFGVQSPLATLGLTAGLSMMPSGYLSSIAPSAAMFGGGMLANTAMQGLAQMQFGLGGLLMGITGGGSALAGGFGMYNSATGGLLGTGLNFNNGAGGTFTQMVGSMPTYMFGNEVGEFRLATGMTRANGGPGSMQMNLPQGAFFEDIIAAFMIDVVKDQQEKIGNRMKEVQRVSNAAYEIDEQAKSQGWTADQTAAAYKQAGINGNSESRNIEFEMIKNEVQKLTQMQQALSNVLNTMHEQAMTAIRQIKG